MTKLKLKKRAKFFIIFSLTIIILIVILLLANFYISSPINKNSNKDIDITIEKGMHTSEIAKLLKNNNLIRSEFLFKVKAKLKNKALKASVYELNKSMSLDEIIDIISDGNTYNPNVVRFTFKEGKTLKKYALEIAEKTDNNYDDIIKLLSDKVYLKELINKYWFLTDDILDSNLYYPLEGYLFPNTYEFTDKEVDTKEIIETMLDQSEKQLNKYKSKMDLSTKTVHYYLTLASILELEGTNTKDRKMIAGVFENRLSSNMNLGSDVTTYYGLQKEMTSDLTVNEFNSENLYNTRASNMRGKLPIGPICNPSLSSIEASINSTDNDYLYFVADKNGKIYYSKTNEEHLSTVTKIKEAGDWIW